MTADRHRDGNVDAVGAVPECVCWNDELRTAQLTVGTDGHRRPRVAVAPPLVHRAPRDRDSAPRRLGPPVPDQLMPCEGRCCVSTSRISMKVERVTTRAPLTIWVTYQGRFKVSTGISDHRGISERDVRTNSWDRRPVRGATGRRTSVSQRSTCTAASRRLRSTCTATSRQRNSTQGRIAAAHISVSRIHQLASSVPQL